MSDFEKTFWIEGVQLSEIDGQIFIPTAIRYEKDGILVGNKAYQAHGEKEVNHNFKIDLGRHEIGAQNYKKFPTNTGIDKSAFEISKDFFEGVLRKFDLTYQIKKEDKDKIKIIIAEPLSIHIKEDENTKWIKNYRKNIKRILDNYGEIDFLPEPFAVYQYYRYGIKIPQLLGKNKNVILVIDFGGGTFDVSVIETTNAGDISASGKHSKPLAGDSVAFGGYKVNRAIAEYLLKRDVEGTERKKIAQNIETLTRVERGQTLFDELGDEKKSFISHFTKLSQKLEFIKISLCNSITNWELDSDCYEKTLVKMPKDPFSIETSWTEKTFYGHELRKLFIDEIWHKELKTKVKNVLLRSKEELKGKEFSATLISGGSSNIRWLEKLITRDFSDEINNAMPISLTESFQEIVAKGLAIECARRYHNPDSEFISVTYNPVKLFLESDGIDIENTKFSSVENKVDMSLAKNNDLLPSAQAIKNFINESIEWKFKPTHPPKRNIKYFFTKQPLGENDSTTENWYNIDNLIHTPKGMTFDSKIRVELTIKEDGTAIPRFIYQKGNHENDIPEKAVTGKPFVLDMTTEGFKKTNANRYIGFDFGTSNSSICFLTNNDIQVINNRNNDIRWMELKDMVSKLPYPISYPIRKYLSSTETNRYIENARNAFESMLAIAAYTAFSELMMHDNQYHTLLKTFQHRSLGPLKELLMKSLDRLGNKALFSQGYKDMFTTHKDALDIAMREFNDHKHDKLNEKNINVHEHLMLMANICNKALFEYNFGFFEISKPIKFRKEYENIFRISNDQQPFIDVAKYEGTELHSPHEVFLIQKKTGKMLCLSPFIFINENEDFINNLTFLIYDKKYNDDFMFKLLEHEESVNLSTISDDLKSQMESIYQGKEVNRELNSGSKI